MRKVLLGVLLILLGVLLIVFGFYTSFEVYVKDKIGKSYKTIGYFLVKILQGESLVETPDKRDTIIILKTPQGKIYATQNISFSMDKRLYRPFEGNVDNYYISIYTKDISLSEYVEYVFLNPLVIGISFSGLLLIIIGLYIAIPPQKMESKKEVLEGIKKSNYLDEKLINQLKALKLVLATSKIEPEESLREAKSIIDSIIEKYGRQKL